jgi:hypothetical protein
MSTICFLNLFTLRRAVIRRSEEAEKTMRLIAYASGEKQPIAGSSGGIVAEPECPQTVILERMFVGIAEKAIEVPAVDVINGDLAAASVSYQQVITEEAKVGRRKCHSPRRV